MHSYYDAVFYSEKRRLVLLELLSGPLSTNDLIERLNETPVALLPQIKRLADEGLITNSDSVCSLTMIGKLITEQSEPLIKNAELIDKNTHYWSRYDLSAIPEFLRKRLYEIGDFRIIEVDLRSVYYEPNPDINDMIKNARYIRTFTTMNQPEYVEIYYSRVRAGAKMEILIPKILLDILKTNPQNIEKISDMPQDVDLSFYETPANIKIAEVTVTEDVLMLTLYPTKENLDYRYVISEEKRGIKWGNELIDYIKGLSVLRKKWGGSDDY